jgi:dihydroorotate dehydrogenase electron transfer subunit
MGIYTGRVSEIVLNPDGSRSARIECPEKAVPAAGRYLLAQDRESILSAPLFLVDNEASGFLAASPIPERWFPGLALELRGPFGYGFHLPAEMQRLAAIALGGSAARLLPVIGMALEKGAAVTLFGGSASSGLPLSVEAYPLSAFPEAQGWADYQVVDTPLETLPDLREKTARNLAGNSVPGQALVFTPMPCGGLGDCGACAIQSHRSWKLACKDGPVFNLKDLE